MCDKSGKLKKYELVAPDGGWGYLICLSFIINTDGAARWLCRSFQACVFYVLVTFFFNKADIIWILNSTESEVVSPTGLAVGEHKFASLTMFIGCFGLLYNDFMIEIGMNSTITTLVTGVNAFCFAMAGFLTNSLLKLMSFRKLCMLSVVMHDAGAIGMAFVKSIPLFFLCQGIMMGVGVGICYNLSCSLINDYFVKKRMFAFSLVQFFCGLSIAIAPIFVKWSLEEYGYRGTLLLVAGVMIHNIFAVMLMQPVKWHMKKVDVLPEAEIQPLLVGEKNNSVQIKVINEEKATTQKASESIDDEVKKLRLRRFLETFVDVPFAKKFILSCTCIGPAIGTFCDSTYSLILPQALYALNWTPDKVALALSLNGVGDLVTRSIFIFASDWMVKIGNQQIYIAGFLLACLSRLGMLWAKNEIAIYIYMLLMGVARSVLYVLLAVVISEATPSEKFTQAMGISMLFTGFTLMTLGPAIGAIRDLTNSYNTAFYLLTSCFAIMAIFWSIELCYKMNKDKRKIQKENLEKIRINRLNKGK